MYANIRLETSRDAKTWTRLLQICCLLSKQSWLGEMKRSRPYYQSFTSVENQKLCGEREIGESLGPVWGPQSVRRGVLDQARDNKGITELTLIQLKL